MDGDDDGYASDDCDDTDPAVNPGATEVWYDGVDQDCSGGSDFDQDGDGEEGADCDDTDPAAHPGATDPLGDGADQDCDGFDGSATPFPVSVLVSDLQGPRFGENADGIQLGILGHDAASGFAAIEILTLQASGTDLLVVADDLDLLDNLTLGTGFDLEVTGSAAAPPWAFASVAVVDGDGEAHLGLVPFHGGWTYGSSDFVDPPDFDAIDLEVTGTALRAVGCASAEQWAYFAVDDTTAIGSPAWASAVSLAPGAGSRCAVHGDTLALIGGDALEEFTYDATNALALGPVVPGALTDVQWEPAARMLVGGGGIALRPESGIELTSASEAVHARFAVGGDGTFYVASVNAAGQARLAWGSPGALVEVPIASALSSVLAVDVHVALDGRVWVAMRDADQVTVSVFTPL